MLWHPKINQLAVGTTESQIHVLYDPALSTKGGVISTTPHLPKILKIFPPKLIFEFRTGALLSVIRKPREKDPSDFEPTRPIITPHSLPLYAETPSQKRKEARASRNSTLR